MRTEEEAGKGKWAATWEAISRAILDLREFSMIQDGRTGGDRWEQCQTEGRWAAGVDWNVPERGLSKPPVPVMQSEFEVHRSVTFPSHDRRYLIRGSVSPEYCIRLLSLIDACIKQSHII